MARQAAANAPKLSTGCVQSLAAGSLKKSGDAGPTVQVICRKPAREGCQDRRTSLRISDGCHYILALLAEDIKDPQEGSVIQLLDWSCGIHEGLQAIFVEDWDQSLPDSFGILGAPVGIPTVLPGAPKASAPLLVSQAAKMIPCPVQERPIASPMRGRSQVPLPACSQPDSASLASPLAMSAMMPASAALPVVPIGQLSSFMQRCRVIVRVLCKSEIRPFNNARGPGKLFSMDLMDAEGSFVRAACFNAAADKYFSLIQIKKTYEISGAAVKPGNPRFCKYPFELTIEGSTSVVALPEDGSIPPMPYKFVPLAQLATAPVGSTCDVMGVVHSVDPPISVATRNQGPRVRRRFVIIDSSQAAVGAHIWGEKTDIQFGVGSVVFIRNAKISDFSGRSLDLNAGSFLDANPDDQRAFKLEAWYQGGGKSEPVRFMLTSDPSSNRGRKRSLAEVRQEDAMLQLQGDGGGEKARTVNFHRVSPVTVLGVRNERAPFYWGCTSEVPGYDSKPRMCNKKVENGQCTAGHICPEPAARFNLNLQLADSTSMVFCRAFGDAAEALADVPASEFAVLEDERLAGSIQAEKTYSRIFRNMFRRWALTLKCRKECFEGRTRVQVSVESCEPVDFIQEGKEMAAAVRHALRI